MSLGSSIGNFGRADASSFLEHFSKILIPGRDCLLIGLDGCQDSSRVYASSLPLQLWIDGHGPMFMIHE